MHVLKNPPALLLGGLLAISVPVWAQYSGQMNAGQSNPSPSAASQPSRSAHSADQRAADLLNTINAGEVKTADLISGKTADSNVKDFASTIKSDHQNLQSQLQSVASQSKINLKTNNSLQRENQKLNARLQKESAQKADKAYAQSEIRDHRQAIRRLQNLEPQISDPQLKNLVQTSIPVLQKHLQDAQHLESQLRGAGAAAAPASNSSGK